MICLIFGTALQSDWTTVGVQMICSIGYYLLLFYRRYNVISLDSLARQFRAEA
jgi:hypothetical protein